MDFSGLQWGAGFWLAGLVVLVVWALLRPLVVGDGGWKTQRDYNNLVLDVLKERNGISVNLV